MAEKSQKTEQPIKPNTPAEVVGNFIGLSSAQATEMVKKYNDIEQGALLAVSKLPESGNCVQYIIDAAHDRILNEKKNKEKKS